MVKSNKACVLVDGVSTVEKIVKRGKTKNFIDLLLRASDKHQKQSHMKDKKEARDIRKKKLNDQKLDSKKLKQEVKEAKMKQAEDAITSKKRKQEVKDVKMKQAEDAITSRMKLKQDTENARNEEAAKNKASRDEHRKSVEGIMKKQESLKSRRNEKPVHEVDLATPYCVRAAAPMYEANIPCSVKVDEEPVSMYVDDLWVKTIVDEIQSGSADDYTDFHKYIQIEYGPLFKTGMLGNFRFGISNNVVKKLFYINQAFVKMTMLKCKDPRCVILTGRNIIEPDRFMDEINGEVMCMMRRGRGFTVNDPLSFNSIMRKLQSIHPTFPRKTNAAPARGTKGMTDVLILVGIGPPSAAHAHKSPLFRGYRSTDPDKVNPNGPMLKKEVATSTHERDGLYFRRYEFTIDRVYMGIRRHGNFKTQFDEVGYSTATFDIPIAQILSSEKTTTSPRQSKRSLLELYEQELEDSE